MFIINSWFSCSFELYPRPFNFRAITRGSKGLLSWPRCLFKRHSAVEAVQFAMEVFAKVRKSIPILSDEIGFSDVESDKARQCKTLLLISDAPP